MRSSLIIIFVNSFWPSSVSENAISSRARASRLDRVSSVSVPRPRKRFSNSLIEDGRIRMY
ncbi:unnamed protein product [Schistosoma mattheei]|uniref:Uncharacterized protein n=1 Tax=Schistosoma mattheei TaxID=31246 RepID=A0A3P8ETB0_9TREM|nr:unnamed protein product [Schistosoma mattheei]